MNLKLFDPEQEPTAAPESPAAASDPGLMGAVPVAKRGPPRPKCRCGCGKAAHWPQDANPVFHSRLCGYLMALKMIRRKVRSKS